MQIREDINCNILFPMKQGALVIKIPYIILQTAWSNKSEFAFVLNVSY
jgi:hypothetical protein